MSQFEFPLWDTRCRKARSELPSAHARCEPLKNFATASGESVTAAKHAMATDQRITLRLTIGDPVPGVSYSLQNKKSEPVGMAVAGDRPLSFDVPVSFAPGPRFFGEFVRREGPTRRFVYIAIGGQAGDSSSLWSRRAKIDIHDLPVELLEKALAGEVVEAVLPGRARDGSPACATLRPLGS